MARSRAEIILLSSVLIICGLLYQRAALRPGQSFLGFQNLSWEAVGSCSIGLADTPPFVSLPMASAPSGGACRSELFARRGNRLEVEYLADAGRKRRDKLAVSLESENGALIESFTPIADGKWHARPIDLEPGARGTVRLVFRNDGAG